MACVFENLSSVLESVPPRYDGLANEYRRRLPKYEKDLKLLNKEQRNGHAANGSHNVVSATAAFSLLFGDLVTLPDTRGSASLVSYEEMQQRSWSLNCWLPAACFLRLRNVIDVAIALVIVDFFKAPFVIRGVGHNTNPGFSSIDGGILLDIRALDTVNLTEDKGLVSVGPAAAWSAVYEELQKHELTTVGARAGVVGVGGFILGGKPVLTILLP
jgi:hypothetical protein